MSVPARLGLFAVLLALVFGGAALAGGAIDPEGADPDAGHSPTAATAGDHTAGEDAGHGVTSDGHTAGEDAGHGVTGDGHAAQDADTGDAAAPAALPGLAAESDGLRLDLATRVADAAGRVPVRFRILDADGDPVRAFDVAHDKRMHLVVVRRDLGVFRHVHPTLAPDGTWSTRVDLPAAGTYRVFADFTIDGEQRTLGTDLHVPGDLAPEALPDPATTAVSDLGAVVRMRRDGDRLAFEVIEDGARVDDRLEDHLGAKGHLVALRASDLAYLHTHPDGDVLAFDVAFPTADPYRVWVEFRLAGRVHTAAFTVAGEESVR